MTSQHDWKVRSACRRYDPDLWWPERPTEGTARAAVGICNTCQVRDDCLDTALAGREDEGIWGGLLPHQRRRLRYAAGVA